MKPLILALVLIFIQNPQSTTPSPSGAGGNQAQSVRKGTTDNRGAFLSQKPVSGTRPVAHSGESSQPPNRKDVHVTEEPVATKPFPRWAEWTAWASGVLLTLVGIVGTFVAVRTLCLIKDQTIAGVRAAEAAKFSADTASENLVAFKDTERPWIEVSIESPPPRTADYNWVAVTLRNYGRTVARVTEIVIEKVHDATIQTITVSLTQSEGAEELDGETLIAPGAAFNRMLNLMPWGSTDPLNPSGMMSFVRVKGLVKYTGTAVRYTGKNGDEYITRFCYARRLPVVRRIEELNADPDTLREILVSGFRKLGPFPLNKYT